MPMTPEICTLRLLLRPWRAADAVALHPVLVANHDYLAPWIPPRIADPATVELLAERLAGFAADFESAREWRYGLFTPDEQTVLGEVGLYPRTATGRVPYDGADRVELGYWLREDATGQGFVTEAARALLTLAAALDHLTHVEIRCDARNEPSAAIPRRLGFTLETTITRQSLNADAPPMELQVWTSRLPVVFAAGA
jgi:RimJ/RimL family protein N-acetyltransferase